MTTTFLHRSILFRGFLLETVSVVAQECERAPSDFFVSAGLADAYGSSTYLCVYSVCEINPKATSSGVRESQHA